MKRQCYYKESLVLFHANYLFDYYNFDYNTSTQDNNKETEIQVEIGRLQLLLFLSY